MLSATVTVRGKSVSFNPRLIGSAVRATDGCAAGAAGDAASTTTQIIISTAVRVTDLRLSRYVTRILHDPDEAASRLHDRLGHGYWSRLRWRVDAACAGAPEDCRFPRFAAGAGLCGPQQAGSPARAIDLGRNRGAHGPRFRVR